ncbi:glycoside hydrolase family protein [Thalassospira sp. SM2505]
MTNDQSCASNSIVWQKLGLIFTPDSSLSWSKSHASLPVPLQINDSLYRVFYASRDENNRSHVGSFDIDLKRPTEVLAVSKRPVLAPGPLGHFDSDGVYAASVVRIGKRVHLYTIGWNSGPRPPLFYASIGLAISTDNGLSFEKYKNAPIMARSEYDPCLVTAPVVLFENSKWRMWYVSGYSWDETGLGPRSNYHIKYAESEDGIHWLRHGHIALDHAGERERNISRTWVRPDGKGYQAWYGYNPGDGFYRIGYAESDDGLEWTRLDNRSGIDLSQSGWDADAMSYPAVIEWQGRRFMFYNGNGFGRDGIGLAVS